MRTATLFAISLVAVAAQAQDGWKNPKVVFASFTEKYGEAAERKLDLLQKNGQVSYRTNTPINGELDGVNRIESVGPAGAFTWVEGRSDFALQLLTPSVADTDEYFTRPAFSRADLEFNVAGIEKALNAKVYVGKQEAIAGRDCLVLRVAGSAETSASDYQKLWIDRETGLTMKQQDSFAGKITYWREVSKIDYKESAAAAVFAFPDKAVIIRGLVSPVTLLHTGSLGGYSDFRTDIEKINSAVKEGQKAWAGAFDASYDVRYAQTNFRDLRVQTVTVGAAASQSSNSRNNRNGNNQNRRRNAFGSSQNQNGDVITFQIAGEPGGGNLQLATAVRVSRSDIAISDDAGTPQPGTGGGTSGGGTSTTNPSMSTYPFAQSDFVDPATGETLTLLQSKGRSVEPMLGNLVLGKPKVVANVLPLETAKIYSVSGPIKMNILVWKVATTNYALASTKLQEDDLVAIAKKVKTAQ